MYIMFICAYTYVCNNKKSSKNYNSNNKLNGHNSQSFIYND